MDDKPWGRQKSDMTEQLRAGEHTSSPEFRKAFDFLHDIGQLRSCISGESEPRLPWYHYCIV